MLGTFAEEEEDEDEVEEDGTRVNNSEPDKDAAAAAAAALREKQADRAQRFVSGRARTPRGAGSMPSFGIENVHTSLHRKTFRLASPLARHSAPTAVGNARTLLRGAGSAVEGTGAVGGVKGDSRDADVDGETVRNTETNGRSPFSREEATALYKAAPKPKDPRYTVMAVPWTPPHASFWTTPSAASMEGQQSAAEKRALQRMQLKNKVERLHDGVDYWSVRILNECKEPIVAPRGGGACRRCPRRTDPSTSFRWARQVHDYSNLPAFHFNNAVLSRPPMQDELDRPRSPTKVLIARRNVSDAIDAPGALMMSVAHVSVIRRQKGVDRALNAEKMPLLARSKRIPKLHTGPPNPRLYHDYLAAEFKAKSAAAAAEATAETAATTDAEADKKAHRGSVTRDCDHEGSAADVTEDAGATVNGAKSVKLALPVIGSQAKGSPDCPIPQSHRARGRSRRPSSSTSITETALTRANREHALWLAAETTWLQKLSMKGSSSS